MKEKISVIICLGSSCYSRGNAKTLEVIKDYLNKSEIKDQIDFRGKLCTKNCDHGPVLFINDKKFLNIKSTEILQLLDQELKSEYTSKATF